LEEHSVRNIVVIGSGVVGEATGRGFIRKGHKVTFVDVNPTTIAKLTAAGLDARTIEAVDWAHADIVMLAVSTPTVGGAIVLTHIETAARSLGEQIKNIDHFLTVVVRSTVLPTTTEHRIKPIIEMSSGKVAGEDLAWP
jgi:UDPglucose 6-dehydrogenase